MMSWWLALEVFVGCIARFRYVDCQFVGLAVLEGGVNGVPDPLEKLQMSSANWIEGIGMSTRDGGSQSVLNANIKSAMKRLK